MGTRKFREYSQNQPLLFPPDLRDWLEEGHLAFFISEVVDGLDFEAFLASYATPTGSGAPPFDPRMMAKILIYGYATGVFSSRKIAAKCVDDVAFRFLSSQQFPDFRSIIKFRRRHVETFRELFQQVAVLAQEMGMVNLGNVVIDGSKVKANASKHKAMSYDRMKQEEERLRKEILELTRRGKTVDKEEDEEFGDWDGHSLPEELQTREKRLAVIQAARKRLEERARLRAEEEKKRREKENTDRKNRGDPPAPPRKDPDPTPGPREQENFTDPESRIMLDGATKGFVQGFNCQLAVDREAQIIIGVGVDNNAADCGKLVPMVETVHGTMGRYPDKVIVDAGYKSEGNIQGLSAKGIDGYVGCCREVYDPRIRCPRGRPPRGLSVIERMKRKLLTKAGRELYRIRKHVVEPVFGWIKQILGFRQFGLRGLKGVRGEWDLVCASLNLRRMALLAR